MDFKACEECTKRGTPGWISDAKSLEKCQCLIEHDKKVLQEQRLSQSGLKTFYLDYDITTYISKSASSKKNLTIIDRLITNIDAFIRNGSQLYVYGAHNTQKTSVISHLVKQVALQDIPVYYITMPQIVDVLMRANEYGESEMSLAAESLRLRLESTDLLVIDDAFDTSKLYFSGKSNYKVTLMDSFFASRREDRRSNIYLSTVDKHEINLDVFGVALTDMLKVNCLDLKFEDRLNEEDMRSSLLKHLTA